MQRRDDIQDGALVLRCQQRDPAAFEQLVGRWHERLWRHAWRLTGDEQAAWDVAQETWIAISRGIHRIADPNAFPAWAYRIASNKSTDWIRRRTRRRDSDKAFVETAEQAKAHVAEIRRNARDLRSAMSELPGADRALLNLHYVEGFDTIEIAEVLQIPRGTVKSRLFKARERLRAVLEVTDGQT